MTVVKSRHFERGMEYIGPHMHPYIHLFCMQSNRHELPVNSIGTWKNMWPHVIQARPSYAAMALATGVAQHRTALSAPTGHVLLGFDPSPVGPKPIDTTWGSLAHRLGGQIWDARLKTEKPDILGRATITHRTRPPIPAGVRMVGDPGTTPLSLSHCCPPRARTRPPTVGPGIPGRCPGGARRWAGAGTEPSGGPPAPGEPAAIGMGSPPSDHALGFQWNGGRLLDAIMH